MIRQPGTQTSKCPSHKQDLRRLQKTLAGLGWQCALYRWPTTDPRNPPNRAVTTAAMNAIVAWHAERWLHVCWLWEVGELSERELLARLAV